MRACFPPNFLCRHAVCLCAHGHATVLDARNLKAAACFFGVLVGVGFKRLRFGGALQFVASRSKDSVRHAHYSSRSAATHVTDKEADKKSACRTVSSGVSLLIAS